MGGRGNSWHELRMADCVLGTQGAVACVRSEPCSWTPGLALSCPPFTLTWPSRWGPPGSAGTSGLCRLQPIYTSRPPLSSAYS